jgi:PAS domain S-box-containing protein
MTQKSHRTFQTPLIYSAAIALALAIFVVDLNLLLGVAGGILYIAVILLGWALPNPLHIVSLAIVSSILTFLGYLYSPQGGTLWIVITNRCFALFAIWITTIVLMKAKKEMAHAKESEARFRDYVRSSSDHFWEIDENFRYTDLSQFEDDAEPLSKQSMIGKIRWEIPGVDPEDDNWKAHRADLLAHRPFQKFDYEQKSENGNSIWMRSSGVPIFDKDNNFKGYRGTNIETTSELEANIAREESEKKFRSLFEMAGDSIFLSDANTRKFIDVSNSAAERLGYTVEEFADMEIHDITADFDAKASKSRRAELRRDGNTVFEAVHRRKDGSTFPVEINSRLLTIGGKEVVEAMARDISERKEVDRLKDEFVSTVSHELRTPLTSIKGALGLIKSGVGGDIPEKMQSILEIAGRNCERLILLIGDILDMEKIEAGKIDYEMERVDILALVKNSVIDNEHYGEQFDVTFVLNGTENETEMFVEGDTTRLMQVMSNLLSNAAKFSPSGDEVVLSVVPNGSTVRISVSDHGPGIPKKSRNQIFEKFFQSDSSSSREKGGTGLGLSISKAIV